MNNKNIVEEVLNTLMNIEPGVVPNSIMPVEAQMERQRLKYRKMLEIQDTIDSITNAMEVISNKYSTISNVDDFELFIKKIVDHLKKELNIKFNSGKKIITDDLFEKIFSIGRGEFLNKNFSNASDIFTLLCLLDPVKEQYWFCLGIADQELKKYERAIGSYEKAIKMDPGNIFYQCLLLECLMKSNKHFDGVALVRKIEESVYKQDTSDYKVFFEKLKSQLHS